MNDQQTRPGTWAERYRPTTLAQMALDPDVRKKFDRYLASERLPTNLILHGPPGFGKTTFVDVLCRQFYGAGVVAGETVRGVMRVAAEQSGNVQHVRERVIAFMWGGLTTGPAGKLVIFEEADGLSREAQDALKVPLEQFTDTTRVIFVTNHLEKLDAALRSRCENVDMGKPPLDERVRVLSEVLSAEHATVDPALIREFTSGNCRSDPAQDPHLPVNAEGSGPAPALAAGGRVTKGRDSPRAAAGFGPPLKRNPIGRVVGGMMTDRRKKHTPPKRRDRLLWLDFGRDVPIDAVKVYPDGRVEFLHNGVPQSPERAHTQLSYERPAKAPKVVARASLGGQTLPTHPDAPLHRADRAFWIDTNSRTHQGQLIHAAAVLLAQPRGRTASHTFLQWDMAGGMEFRGNVERPEAFAWCELIENVRRYPRRRLDWHVVIVVDSDLGLLEDINARRKPIWRDYWLPPGFEFVYASADVGAREPLNAFMRICDVQATKLFERIIQVDPMGLRAAELSFVPGGPPVRPWQHNAEA